MTPIKPQGTHAMYSRRTFFRTAGVAAAAVATTSVVRADEEACAVFTPDRQKDISPDQALQLLKDGNARFIKGKTVNCDLRAQVKATSGYQSPFAAIVGCIDSRVPPELVFDQQLGAVFAARIAGNFINDDIIGSLEFATKVAGAKAVVILGHSECGAIKGAIDHVKLGFLTKMLANIEPAIEAVQGVEGDRKSKNKAFVQAVAEKNAILAAKMLTDKSDVLRELVEQKQLVIAAAMRDISTGEVKFLS